MTSKPIYPAGTCIIFEEGEYSDYGVLAVLITLKKCDMAELVQAHEDNYVPKDGYDRPSPSSFVAWLITQGYAMTAETQSLHIGSYGKLEL